jgi:hypothetical protein
MKSQLVPCIGRRSTDPECTTGSFSSRDTSRVLVICGLWENFLWGMARGPKARRKGEAHSVAQG